MKFFQVEMHSLSPKDVAALIRFASAKVLHTGVMTHLQAGLSATESEPLKATGVMVTDPTDIERKRQLPGSFVWIEFRAIVPYTQVQRVVVIVNVKERVDAIAIGPEKEGVWSNPLMWKVAVREDEHFVRLQGCLPFPVLNAFSRGPMYT